MAFVPPPPTPRRGFGWRRVAKNPDRNRNPTSRLGRPVGARAISGPTGRGPFRRFRFYLFTFRVLSNPLHITCCLRRTCTTRFRDLLDAPSLSSPPSATKPNRASVDADGPGKTTVTVPIIILNYYLLFSKTRTRLPETCRRSLLSIVVCWLHWCWAETLPTPPVMTLSPRLPPPLPVARSGLCGRRNYTMRRPHNSHRRACFLNGLFVA